MQIAVITLSGAARWLCQAAPSPCPLPPVPPALCCAARPCSPRGLFCYGPLHSLGCCEGWRFLSVTMCKILLFFLTTHNICRQNLDGSIYSKSVGVDLARSTGLTTGTAVISPEAFRKKLGFYQKNFGESNPLPACPQKSPNSNCSWSFSVQNYFSLVQWRPAG